MKLFKYIGKGLYICLINPILMLCKGIFLIIKYFFKGLFAPIILLTGNSKNNEAKEEKVKIEKKKLSIEELAALKEAKRLALEKLKKEKVEAKRLKKIEDERIRKERAEQRRIKKAQEAEKRRLRKIELERIRKEKAEARRIKKEQEKEARRLKKIENERIRKERAEQRRIKKEQEKEQRRLDKIRRAEERERRKQETAEERKLRKIKEKQEKIEKAKLDRQKKIEAIHEKNAKKEDALYRKEKEKAEAKKLKEEAKKKKKEAELARKAERKKRQNESYVNENVVIEKEHKLSGFAAKLAAIPKNIKKKLENNSFARNTRNKRDMNRQALLIDFEGEEAKRSDIKLVYEYQAKSPEGKVVTGHFEAFSKVEVHSFLLSEGYEVYKIHTNKWIALKYSRTASNKKKFKNKDLTFFLTQLSTYLKAGITLSEALKILARQFASNKAYENIFKSINYELSIGENFSETLAKQGHAFPPLLINMLKTAEMTGSLPEVLDDMAEYYSQMEETRRQMVTAMMYPSIVGVFAIGVITFIMVYVVPQFVEIYNTMDSADIPAFTKAVMAISDFLKNNLVMLIIVIVIVIFVFYTVYKKNRFFKTIVQMGLMKMPAIGNVIIYNEVTTFTKTFGSLLSHNVPIIDCMDILNKLTDNEIYKMLILDVITTLARGGKISESFEGHWAFPVPAYEMIVTGEKTGELAEMMTKVSLYYQDLHKNSVTRIKTLIEPALTVFLAGATGMIVLAIVIPMFNMYDAVQQY